MSLSGGAPKTRRYSRLNCDGLSWPTRRQAEAGIADFIAEGHFSRHLKKMRLLYAERRALTSRVFLEILGDRIRIDLQPGRLHIVAKLADHEDDVMLADHARTAGLALHPLSRCYINAKPQQGLLLGFANVIDEKEAMRLALKLKQALQSDLRGCYPM